MVPSIGGGTTRFVAWTSPFCVKSGGACLLSVVVRVLLSAFISAGRPRIGMDEWVDGVGGSRDSCSSCTE